MMEKWKKIFIGDLKELIKYLCMIDDYFHENNGRFTLTELKVCSCFLLLNNSAYAEICLTLMNMCI